MKKLLFTLFAITFLFSCKKNDVRQEAVANADSLRIPPLGGVTTEESVFQSIPYVDDLDTSRIPRLWKGTSLPVFLPVPNVGDQNLNGFGDCTAWAVGYGMMTSVFSRFERASNLNTLDQKFSPTYIWNQLNGGRKELGITIYQACSLVQQQGCCKWQYMSGDISSHTVQPSADARKNADGYRISQFKGIPGIGRFRTVNVELIKYYLSIGYPIPFEANIDTGFTGYAKEASLTLLSDGRKVYKNFARGQLGLHTMLICGFDDNISAFYVMNSWGSAWGNNGFVWIDYNFLDAIVQKHRSEEPELFICFFKPPLPQLTTNAATNITSSSALSGGNISKDGGTEIFARGTCWSKTNHTPTINDAHSIDGTGTGAFTSNITGLDPNTQYFIRAYAINKNDTAYGDELNFTTSGNPTPSIGDHAYGGIIFYIDGSGLHGLVAAITDQSSAIAWDPNAIVNGSYNPQITGATGSAIGTGSTNTSTIIGVLGSSGNAAAICRNYNGGGYSDWFLPSALELSKMIPNATLLGLAVPKAYWSSTEQNGAFTFGNSGAAWDQTPYGVGGGVSNKNATNAVRAIRAF